MMRVEHRHRGHAPRLGNPDPFGDGDIQRRIGKPAIGVRADCRIAVINRDNLRLRFDLAAAHLPQIVAQARKPVARLAIRLCSDQCLGDRAGRDIDNPNRRQCLENQCLGISKADPFGRLHPCHP